MIALVYMYTDNSLLARYTGTNHMPPHLHTLAPKSCIASQTKSVWGSMRKIIQAPIHACNHHPPKQAKTLHISHPSLHGYLDFQHHAHNSSFQSRTLGCHMMWRAEQAKPHSQYLTPVSWLSTAHLVPWPLLPLCCRQATNCLYLLYSESLLVQLGSNWMVVCSVTVCTDKARTRCISLTRWRSGQCAE